MKTSGFDKNGDQLKNLERICKQYHGTQLFNEVTSTISRQFNVDYALIGMLTGLQDKVITLSVCLDHAIAENIEYSLNGTPCENVLFKNACYYPSNVQGLFPTDIILKDLKVETYLAFPLYNKIFNPSGIIVCMDRKEIPYTDSILTALRMTIPYLENEIELYRAQQVDSAS